LTSSFKPIPTVVTLMMRRVAWCDWATIDTILKSGISESPQPTSSK
jgi:hypothetical protein